MKLLHCDRRNYVPYRALFQKEPRPKDVSSELVLDHEGQGAKL